MLVLIAYLFGERVIVLFPVFLANIGKERGILRYPKTWYYDGTMMDELRTHWRTVRLWSGLWYILLFACFSAFVGLAELGLYYHCWNDDMAAIGIALHMLDSLLGILVLRDRGNECTTACERN